MGNFVDNNTLQAMILEILSNDKELLKGILQVIVQEYPQLVEEITSTGVPSLVSEPTVIYKKGEKSNLETASDDVSDEEFNFWVDKHFKKYDAVFKALA